MRCAGRSRRVARFAALLLLGGCAQEVPQDSEATADPVMSRALDEQIMIDPDMVDQNLASSAIDIAVPDGSLPTPELGPRALADARAAALIEIGGPGKLLKAPAAAGDAARLRAQLAANRACMNRVEATMLWAARLPRAFPVYPHGSVQQATGTDAEGCALRLVSFVTPVPQNEVIDYYFTHASQAGFPVERAIEQGEDILWGRKGAAAYVVRVRTADSGATEVAITTRGF